MRDSDKNELRYLSSLAAAALDGARFSHFLSLDAQALVSQAAKAEGVTAELFGGYEDAERRMAAFAREQAPWPIRCIRVSWSKRDSIGHRDLLGALIGLGIKRDVIGDIRVGEGEALVYCEEALEEYLLQHFSKAGRVSLTAQRAETGDEFNDRSSLQDARIVVSSLRIDGILAESYRLSRKAAQEMIVRGLVFCNHRPVTKNDYQVHAKDILSVRGQGRIIIEDIATTRKGRIGLHICRTV